MAAILFKTSYSAATPSFKTSYSAATPSFKYTMKVVPPHLTVFPFNDIPFTNMPALSRTYARRKGG